MENEYWIDEVMSRNDAVKLVKRQRGKGITLFINVGQHAPIVNEPGRVFPIISNVEVTMPAALGFLERAYSDILVNRGAQVRVCGLGKCLFIGQPA